MARETVFATSMVEILAGTLFLVLKRGCHLGVGDAALQAAFLRRLCAELDNRANVMLDHFTQCRIVFFVGFFFFPI